MDKLGPLARKGVGRPVAILAAKGHALLRL
jgi:hypothetical protein